MLYASHMPEIEGKFSLAYNFGDFISWPVGSIAFGLVVRFPCL
jgi:hypothetical protein